MNYSSYLDFADSMANLTREVVLRLWEDSDLEVELKGDSSPVTKVDREVEQLFRKEVARKFSDHGVLGEEFGLTGGEKDFIWVIDPIDGTQSLVNRVPTFGMFLALLHKGEPVVGVIDLPVLRRRVIGAVGHGSHDEQGTRIDLSKNNPISPTDIIAMGTSASFARCGDEKVQHEMLRRFPISRAYYDCFGHYFVATGGISGLLEMNLHSWDVVATEALVKAAGGEVRYLKRPADLTEVRSSVLGKKAAVEAICDVVSRVA